MPRYFFDIDDGHRISRDDEGSEWANFDMARLETMKALPEIALHEIPQAQDGDRQSLTVLVRDASGAVLYVATLSYVGLKLEGGI